jgi:hypothetical protein
MKNTILGFSLITVGCILIYVFAAFTPVIGNLNARDFFRGFSMGIGLFAASYLVVLLIRRAMQKPKAS